MAGTGGGTVARVRLKAAETTGSATSRTRTLSRCGSEVGSAGEIGATLLIGNVPSGFNGTAYGPQEFEDLRSFVARLEAMQSQQRSPQQQYPELDAELKAALSMHPEWRHRMAVTTKSANLRTKILSNLPEGGRACGSASLGFTHPWREDRVPDNFSDHTWPKAATRGIDGLHHLPGGNESHDHLLRAPADKLKHHPLLSQSAFHSIPRNKRFPGTKDRSGEIDATEMQKRGTPGPGAYFKSQPRGTHFSVDGGETVILGANHVCPWKKSLGHNINPVPVDLTSVHSQPCYSFSKTRRSCSETSLGHGIQGGGPVKHDLGCLSPGPVYEHHGTFQPALGEMAPGAIRKRSLSTSSMPRIRMVPAPLREEPKSMEVDRE
mmetsp:Transcript_69079/g.224034  ORF Transcript_69079/g.224034 Transcript_69079/m.224034 type:complete len:378 (-) Transcript_69079:49-1182(-)